VADRVLDVHGGAQRTEGRLRNNDRSILADSVNVHRGAQRTEGRLRKNDRLIVADSVVDDHRRGAQQTEGTRLRNNDRSWLIAWMSTEVLSGLRVGCAKVTVADCCIMTCGAFLAWH
jgi:hypothetical protein